MNTDKIYAEHLANEYAPKNDSKVVALRKLDRRAKLPANIFAYTFGIVSSLVFGVGMCLSMNVIGSGTAASGYTEARQQALRAPPQRRQRGSPGPRRCRLPWQHIS